MTNRYKVYRHRPIIGFSDTLTAGGDFNVFMNGVSTKSVSVSSASEAVEVIPNALLVGGQLVMVGNAIASSSEVENCDSSSGVVTVNGGGNFAGIVNQCYFVANAGTTNNLYPVTQSFPQGKENITIDNLPDISDVACRLDFPAEEYKPAYFKPYTATEFGNAITAGQTITVASGATIKFETDRYPIYSIAVRAAAGAVLSVIPAGD